MTLDEAIKHCEEKAKCGDACGLEHRQLADWLKELKQLRADRRKITTDIYSSLLFPEPPKKEVRKETFF